MISRNSILTAFCAVTLALSYNLLLVPFFTAMVVGSTERFPLVNGLSRSHAKRHMTDGALRRYDTRKIN